jgi:hypothetical protein
MMIAGVAESAALPRRPAGSEPDEVPAGSAMGLRVLLLGAVVILGLATLALFAARGIGSSSPVTPPRAFESAPIAPLPEPEATAAAPPPAPVEAAPSAIDVNDLPQAEPSATSASPPKRVRGRAKPPGKWAPPAASAKPRAPTPMFERPEGH